MTRVSEAPYPGATGPVRLEGVSVTYRVADTTVPALSEFSHVFTPGTSTAIQGRSGSGKSTLVSILSLLRRPTSGAVWFGDVNASRLSEKEVSRLRGLSVGVVFQSFHLDYRADAAENVLLPWVYSGNKPGRRRDARVRAVELLERVGIADLANRLPSQMSGGQRQRVAIARALFNEPTLLIADEPTGNLDEDTAGKIAHDLYALPSTLGATVVVVTHDGAVAAGADVRVHLAHGRTISETSP